MATLWLPEEAEPGSLRRKEGKAGPGQWSGPLAALHSPSPALNASLIACNLGQWGCEPSACPTSTCPLPAALVN